ncbi:MAG: acyltransferase [Chloroflexales bacterium]|nr:acyltransferase [Chloroflexales bacterium]
MKLGQVSREEFGALQPRILLLHMAATLLPPYVGGRLRGNLLRLAGIEVGRHTTILGLPHMYGSGPIQRRLTIGSYTVLNIGCHFDLNDTITIAPHASLGHEVMILTTSHTIGDTEHRAGPLTTKPVAIGAGAWIGARSLILPGVTIGAGSIVAAGAIVTRDVPPNTLVAGVPARILRQI